MKIIYAQCPWGEIVLCEAPPGSKVFWPDGYPVRGGKSRSAVWKTLPTVKDSLKPRTRLVAVASEIQDTPGRFKQALRHAWSKLPVSCQNRGLLGVTLKGEPYEAAGKRWRCVGFFYIPSAKKWMDLYNGVIVVSDKAPKGFPDKTWW